MRFLQNHVVTRNSIIINYYYKRSNRTPKEEPKDYKTLKSPKGSKQDHQENKEEKIYINWIEYKLEIKEMVQKVQ